jgi:hypothetical protein
MATARRTLIAIIGLLLMADAAALAYIKFTGGPRPSDEKSKLVLWIDNAEQAATAGEVIKEQGYEGVVKADKRKSEVEADFRLAMKSSKKELLKPIEKVLRQAGHKQLSYSPDGTMLYYGGLYKQKAQALRQAERLKAQEQLVFEVRPGSKVVSKASNKVVIMSMPSNMIEGLLSEITAKGVEVNDQTEISLEPKEEKPASGSDSEAEE